MKLTGACVPSALELHAAHSLDNLRHTYKFHFTIKKQARENVSMAPEFSLNLSDGLIGKEISFYADRCCANIRTVSAAMSRGKEDAFGGIFVCLFYH